MALILGDGIETETIMPDLDLAVSVRDYARGKGSAALVVSSAWLAREFDVDPRTIAAALRPFGVKPGEVEPGVRGYSIAELAGIVLPEEAPDVLAGRIPTEPSATPEDPDDEPPLVLMGRVMFCAVCNSPVVVVVGADEQVNTCHPVAALLDSPLFEPPASAREMPDGWPGPGWHDLVDPAAVDDGSLKPCRPIPYDDEPEPDAVARLSAGAGHDMTPALRAAGLL